MSGIRRAVVAAGVVALAGVGATAASSLEPTGAHRGGDRVVAQPLTMDKAHPALWARGLPPLIERENERRKARKQEDPPVHPVAGDFDYGGSGAGFGADRYGHVHEGQDVFAPSGTALVAVSDGTVLEAGSDADRGNHVALYSEHTGQTYVYFHMLSAPELSVGETVSAGSRIGEVGCTGACDGEHLHFEVHEGEDAEAPATDPLPLLESWEPSI